MSEKVTLRFEQFDETNDNTVTYQGPINLYKTVDTFIQLTGTEANDFEDGIAYEEGFPEAPLNADNSFDETALPNVVVYVKNITAETGSERYRGAYFRYEYITASWQEIMLGTHSHENKDILDKITNGNIGTWNNLTDYPSVTYDNINPEITDERSTNSLWLNTDTYEIYKAIREFDNETGLFVMTWVRLNKLDDDGFFIPINGTSMPMLPNIGDLFAKTINDTFDSLYIFAGAEAGERKMLVLEVTDPDNSAFTYSYDVAWTEMPEALPIVPENVDENAYLGIDSANNPIWKNTLLPAQIFQLKTIIVGTVAEYTEATQYLAANKWPEGNEIKVSTTNYNPDLDEVLVMDGNFFSWNIDISYDSELEALVITSRAGAIDADGIDDGGNIFDPDSVVTVIIIRNGAAAVLDTLAQDYVTKADAINLLSGGSINLNQYATKTDVQNYAKKDHYHSGYSRSEHNHDTRYANYHHTHAEYTTRRKVLELIEETLGMNPDIINILTEFSDYLETAPQGLVDLINTLENIDIAGLEADISDINAIIDVINTNIDTLSEHVETRRIKTDQIDTKFIGSTEVGSYTKNLTQVLQEIMDVIESDLIVTDTANLFLSDSIEVNIGGDEGGIGGYLDGDIIYPDITNMQQILTTLLRRPVVTDVDAPTMSYSVIMDDRYPEVGSYVTTTVTPTYIRNEGPFQIGRYTLSSSDNASIFTSTLTAGTYTGTIPVATSPIVLHARITYGEGPIILDNLGNYVGQIPVGEIDEDIFTITPVRSIFLGGITTAQSTFVSDDIRRVPQLNELSYLGTHDVIINRNDGIRTIIFALPTSMNIEIESIVYQEQSSTDILEAFVNDEKPIQVVPVEGANGTSGINYNVYHYELPVEANTMHLKVTII